MVQDDTDGFDSVRVLSSGLEWLVIVVKSNIESVHQFSHERFAQSFAEGQRTKMGLMPDGPSPPGRG